MPNSSDEFRNRAANCLSVARHTDDPATRVILLTMAQCWYDLANGPALDFDALVQDFNDQQLTDPPKPVMQQQQQTQPKQEE